MNNIYYYTWYVLYRFLKKINRTDLSPVFFATGLLSLLMAINVTPLIIKSGGFIYRYSVGMVYVKNFFVLVFLLSINYFFIMRNKKSTQIEIFFDDKRNSKQKNTLVVLMAWGYIIGSVVMGWYLWQHTGEMLH